MLYCRFIVCISTQECKAEKTICYPTLEQLRTECWQPSHGMFVFPLVHHFMVVYVNAALIQLSLALVLPIGGRGMLLFLSF